MATTYPVHSHLLGTVHNSGYNYSSTANRGFVLFKNVFKSGTGRFVWQVRSSVSDALFGIFNDNFNQDLTPGGGRYMGSNQDDTDASIGFWIQDDDLYHRVDGFYYNNNSEGLIAGSNVGVWITVELNLDTETITFYQGENGSKTSNAIVDNTYNWYVGASAGPGAIIDFRFDSSEFDNLPSTLIPGWQEFGVGQPDETLVKFDNFKIGREHPDWISPTGVQIHKLWRPSGFAAGNFGGAHLDAPSLLIGNDDSLYAFEHKFNWYEFRDNLNGFDIGGVLTNDTTPIESTVKCYDQITDKLIGVCIGTEYGFNNLKKGRDYYLIAQSREDVNLPAIVINNITNEPDVDPAPEYKPVIHQDLQSVPMNSGDLSYIEVSVQDYDKIDWYKDDVLIKTTRRDFIYLDATKEDVKGEYHIVATNIHGTTTGEKAYLPLNALTLDTESSLLVEPAPSASYSLGGESINTSESSSGDLDTNNAVTTLPEESVQLDTTTATDDLLENTNPDLTVYYS